MRLTETKSFIIIILAIVAFVASLIFYLQAPSKTVLSCTDSKTAKETVKADAIKICDGQWSGDISYNHGDWRVDCSGY